LNTSHKPVDRPNWVDFYLGLSFFIAERSQDADTKHGCVITNRQHRVLSVGYNGLPRNASDRCFTNTGRNKYKNMFHAEQNALANCEHRPVNGIAYVSGVCCDNCLYSLWQHGITTLYMADCHGTKLSNDEDWRKNFILNTGMEVYLIKPNLNWLTTPVDKINQLGFFTTLRSDLGL